MQQFLFKSKKAFLALFLIVLFSLLLSACSIEIVTSTTEDSSGLFNVHFIDVGQGDCIFIKTPKGKTMLIDAGNNGDGETIINYIKQQGTNKLDYVIGTHPHSDHIGALDDIIQHYDIGEIIMPKVTHNSKTYKDVLLAVKEKGLKIKSAKGGSSFPMDDDTMVHILAPNSTSYDGVNDYSVVVKINYKNTSFLFTGDAEKTSEREMLNKNYDLRADVLKVAHHGSSSSTTEEFLSAVSPKYAIICVGKDNKYGHPHKEIIERLLNHDVDIYTTADNGNILMSSDGHNIEMKRK